MATLFSNYLLSSQGDRVSMGQSVECRYPFLDYGVFDFAAALPDTMKIRGLNEKYVVKKLRGAMCRSGLRSGQSWDEALDLVASRLGEIKTQYGADSIAALSSARCTNEENFLMQKFMRAVVGTNNVDHCART
jgi:asparagine synthetase B (glutamine-hydrolysing)